MSDNHPLLTMLHSYYDEYASLRESHQDLDNLNFHRQFGLSLGTPLHWPLISSIAHLIEGAYMREGTTPNIVVIYPSTLVYREMFKALEVEQIEPTFFSWQELYVAMDRAGKDSRELQKFRHILQGTNLAIFLGAPLGIPEVVDQVRGFCEGCLIVIQ